MFWLFALPPLRSLPLPALHPQWFATQLLEANRPRAALRYYERHLASEEETYDDVWFSLVNGALCVALLSERSGKVPPLQLQAARGWLWAALASAPADDRLLSLLRRLSNGDLCADRVALAAAAAAHRRRTGAAIVRSRGAPGLPEAGGTLVVAFAGADSALGGGVDGGVASHQFVRACERAGVRHVLFVRDALRAWYLRGLGTDPWGEEGLDTQLSQASQGDGYRHQAEHGRDEPCDDFSGLLALLGREIAAARPARVVTVGSSMGGCAALPAELHPLTPPPLLHSLTTPTHSTPPHLPPCRYAALRIALELQPPQRSEAAEGRGAAEARWPEVRGIAFSPQVLLSPAARRLAALPPASFDPFLEGCSAVSEVAGFELTSLLQVVARRDRAAAPAVALQVHVGDLAPGDGVEAELLSDAVRAGGGGGRSGAGVSMELVRHAGRGHNLVGDMRDAGELDALLRSFADGA